MLLCVDNLLQPNLVCGDEILNKTKQEKVLVVKLGNKLNFATHLLNITKNTYNKFNALMRVQKYMTTDQKKLIFSSFIKSRIRNHEVIVKPFRQNNKFLAQGIYDCRTSFSEVYIVLSSA